MVNLAKIMPIRGCDFISFFKGANANIPQKFRMDRENANSRKVGKRISTFISIFCAKWRCMLFLAKINGFTGRLAALPYRDKSQKIRDSTTVPAGDICSLTHIYRFMLHDKIAPKYRTFGSKRKRTKCARIFVSIYHFLPQPFLKKDIKKVLKLDPRDYKGLRICNVKGCLQQDAILSEMISQKTSFRAMIKRKYLESRQDK